MKNAEHILSQLGLSEKESRVYLTLAQLGKATAYKIAQLSDLKRPTVYIILDELKKKDLVTKIPYEKAQVFVARPLTELIERQQQALVDAQHLSDKLKKSAPHVAHEVYHYEGASGVQNAIDFHIEDLNGGKSSGILGHLTDDELLPIFIGWHERVREYPDFTYRVLISATDYHKRFTTLRDFEQTGGYVETKIIDNIELPHDFSFEVFQKEKEGDSQFLRIIADKSQHATIIETKEVVTAFQQLFASLWLQAREVDW